MLNPPADSTQLISDWDPLNAMLFELGVGGLCHAQGGAVPPWNRAAQPRMTSFENITRVWNVSIWSGLGIDQDQ
jgi:hypothetical protein